MKKLLFCLFICSFFSYGQSSPTEIYLFDLVINDSLGYYDLKKPRNISINPGQYDDDPSFLTSGEGILFTSTRKKQTDIVLFNIETKQNRWLTKSKFNEFAPRQSPDKKYYSTISVDENDEQILIEFSFSGLKKPNVLIDTLRINNYLWYDQNNIVTTLANSSSTLAVSNISCNIRYPLDTNVGRHFSKLDYNNTIVYLNKDDRKIYSISLKDANKKFLTDALDGSESMALMPDGTIVMGKDDTIYSLKPGISSGWYKMASLATYDLTGIRNIAISPNGKKIAVVVEESSK